MAHFSLTTQAFVERCKHIHANAYDYTATVYTAQRDPVTYRCPQHGLITQAAKHHLAGHGCAACNLGSPTTSPAAASKARARALVEAGRGESARHRYLEEAYKRDERDPEVAEYIRGQFTYDAEAGRLRWAAPAKSRTIGEVASTQRRDKYRLVSLLGVKLLEHRLVWLVVTGAWPEHRIDHIDGDPSHNRMENLRDVPARTNSQNIKAAKAGKTSGLPLGVFRHRARFRAIIRDSQGASVYIGSFPTPEEAHAAYVGAKRVLHEGNTL